MQDKLTSIVSDLYDIDISNQQGNLDFEYTYTSGDLSKYEEKLETISSTYTTDGTSGGWWGVNHPQATDGTGEWNYQPPTTEIIYTDPTQDSWLHVDEALGIVFIDGDEIKLKTKNGKEVTIGRLDDSDEFIPIEAIAAKKKLLEGTDQEGNEA